MEAILISSDRIKIMLSENDMKNYSIKTDDVKSGDGINGKVLRRILRDLPSEIPFEGANSQLHVQVYMLENGCEMFVTRLGEREKVDCFAICLENSADLRMLCKRMKKSGENCPVRVYTVSDRVVAAFERALPLYACDYGSFIESEDMLYVREYGEKVKKTSVYGLCR